MGTVVDGKSHGQCQVDDADVVDEESGNVHGTENLCDSDCYGDQYQRSSDWVGYQDESDNKDRYHAQGYVDHHLVLDDDIRLPGGELICVGVGREVPGGNLLADLLHCLNFLGGNVVDSSVENGTHLGGQDIRG